MCLTESLVQCYMDRELANDLLAQAMAHLDECSKCKSNLDQAMIEEKLVRRALAYEMALPIATVQLISTIDEAIRANEKIDRKLLGAKHADSQIRIKLITHRAE